MGYSTRTSNYPERITLSYLAHMMSMVDPLAIGVEKPRIDTTGDYVGTARAMTLERLKNSFK